MRNSPLARLLFAAVLLLPAAAAANDASSARSSEVRRRVEAFLDVHRELAPDARTLDRVVASLAASAGRPLNEARIVNALRTHGARLEGLDSAARLERARARRWQRAATEERTQPATEPSAPASAALETGRGLSGSGSISGRVTDALTDDPIPDIEVRIYFPNGSHVSSATTDEDGDYLTFANLPAGNYFVRAMSNDTYLSEVYLNLACGNGCNVPSGTPVAVELESTTPDIDFTLVKGGGISGTVTDAGSKAPLEGVQVRIYAAHGPQVDSVVTGANGGYESSVTLEPGPYRVRTLNDLGFLDELHDDLPCGYSCTITAGDDVVVAAGVDTTGIDFALTEGGRISGTVTDDDTADPIEGATVVIQTPEGEYAGEILTAADGTYTTTRALASGTYQVRVFTNGAYLDELWDDIPCWQGCDGQVGAAVAVVVGETTESIDFALARGGKIAGTVTDANSKSVIPNIFVVVRDEAGNYIDEGYTEFDGSYTTTRALRTGTYTASTVNFSIYLDELYEEMPCWLDCDFSLGSGIVVTAPATTGSIDFTLEQGGSISGLVTDSTTASPLENVEVQVWDDEGRFVTSVYTGSGQYLTFEGLKTGNFHLRTFNFLGYIDELYLDQPCAFDCDVTTGTAVAVTAGQNTPDIDVALAPGGKITGTVTRADDQEPHGNFYVLVHDATGEMVAEGHTSGEGLYETSRGLPTGTYYARTVNPEGYLDELYDDLACPFDCDATTGTAIVVTAGATTGAIDFELAKGSRIRGTVVDALTGFPLEDVRVTVIDASGDELAYGYSSGFDGSFQTQNALPNGSYYLTAGEPAGSGEYRSVLFPNLSCPFGLCSPLPGTPVMVTNPTDTNGIDFALSRRMLAGDGFESEGFGAWSGGAGTGPVCEHSICTWGAALDPLCDPCVDQIVTEIELCGSEGWFEECIEATYTLCGVSSCEWESLGD